MQLESWWKITTYEEFKNNQRKIEIINRLLDKLDYMLDKVSKEERQQVLIYMEYLEIEYRKLESKNFKIKKKK